MARPLLVTIDGPAGAGKSATARELARRLGIPYLDTGAMYRAVALAAIRAGIGFPLDQAGTDHVTRVAEQAHVAVEAADGGTRVLLDGDDVTAAVRAPDVSRAASLVSAVTGVRRAMVALQRRLAERTGGVVEGRDIGTVVFPDAPVKVFLTARPDVRGRRRLDELRKSGVAATWEQVLEEQRERDARDSTRRDSPLCPAAGAIILDTSDLTLDEVVERLYELSHAARRSLDSSEQSHL